MKKRMMKRDWVTLGRKQEKGEKERGAKKVSNPGGKKEEKEGWKKSSCHGKNNK